MMSESLFDTILAILFFLIGIIGYVTATWRGWEIPTNLIYFLCCMGIGLMIARTKHQLK